MTVYEKLLQQPKKLEGSIAIELFLQNCSELGHLGEMSVAMNERLRRVEHLADFIQNNPITKSLRYLRKQLKSLV